MVLIPANMLVHIGTWKVLNKGTPQSNVDYLHPFTDAQQRKLVAVAEIYRLNLKNIQFGINIIGTFVEFAEKSRSNIAAARQNHSITAIQFPKGKGCKSMCRYG